MARLACLVAAGILILFALSGQWIFRLLGITLPAFQIAGSVLLLRIALDMLYAKRSAAQETREETEAGATKDDIAITPLGVPMLAGPGATSTSLILMNQAQDWP
jgi:multiple antibiotic resistance protein